MTELSLQVSRTIQAPIEDIYNAWLDPLMLSKFMLPAQSVSVVKAENDPNVGGTFDIIMSTPEQDIPHSGEYKILHPYSQIVFTWESPFSIEGSTVTINLKQTENGTHLELIHVKFPSEESRANHEGGWTAILVCLDELLQETVVA